MAGGVGAPGAGGRGAAAPPRWHHLIAAGVLTANLAVIAAWPWLGGGVRAVCDPFYAAMCHRTPERCYAVGGEPLPACARCVGVWLGLTAAAVVAACVGLWRPAVGLALLAWLIASWAAGWWLPVGWHVERTAAGVAGGLGAYVLAWRLWGWARRRVPRALEPVARVVAR